MQSSTQRCQRSNEGCALPQRACIVRKPLSAVSVNCKDKESILQVLSPLEHTELQDPDLAVAPKQDQKKTLLTISADLEELLGSDGNDWDIDELQRMVRSSQLCTQLTALFVT